VRQPCYMKDFNGAGIHENKDIKTVKNNK